MNSNEQSNSSISMDSALTEEITRNFRLSMNVSQQFIVTTEDKLRLCLLAHLCSAEKRKDWLAPAGVFATLIATLVATSTFKDFVLKAAEWKALFVCASSITFIWLVYAAVQAILSSSKGIEGIVSELKRGNAEDLANILDD